jgi:23S rRNA (adenine1618-N6)-methyltransferase
MQALSSVYPALTKFLSVSPGGKSTINFADNAAVIALNTALLAHHHGVAHWNLPEGYLCPPVPGRADYLHHLADLMTRDNRDVIPHGPLIEVLDIGVGAGCIFPILGNSSYGWSFVGSDIDEIALANARTICSTNEKLAEHVKLRLQKNQNHYFKGVVGSDEQFDAIICNPPFYGSEQEALEASDRKWRNLGKTDSPGRNFGGSSKELYCAGGELSFIRGMIAESFFYARKVYWFTTLVSRKEHIHELRRALQKVRPTEVAVIPMSQGQKSSHILAWTFLEEPQRRHWRDSRFWGN